MRGLREALLGIPCLVATVDLEIQRCGSSLKIAANAAL